jgi:hypothetical protein
MEDAVSEGEDEGGGGGSVGAGALTVAVAVVVPVGEVASRLHPSPITAITAAATAPVVARPLAPRSPARPRREHPIPEAYPGFGVGCYKRRSLCA